MRYLSIICIFLSVLFLLGCASHDTPDINRLTELINKNESININLSSVITVKKEYTEYIYFYNNHLLFKAYADENGRITCCCITSDRADTETAEELFEAVLQNLCNADTAVITEALKKNQFISEKGWNYRINSNPVADCYLIYSDKFNLISDDLPTLKNLIEP